MYRWLRRCVCIILLIVCSCHPPFFLASAAPCNEEESGGGRASVVNSLMGVPPMDGHMSHAKRDGFHIHSGECTWKPQVSLCENATCQSTGA